MLRMDVERVMRQRSLKPREGTDIYLMNVPRRYAGLQKVKSVGFLCRAGWRGFWGAAAQVLACSQGKLA